MTKSQARSMLGSAFGPGDLVEKLNEMQHGYEFTMDEGNELMDWMAEQLTDEPEEGESDDEHLDELRDSETPR